MHSISRLRLPDPSDTAPHPRPLPDGGGVPSGRRLRAEAFTAEKLSPLRQLLNSDANTRKGVLWEYSRQHTLFIFSGIAPQCGSAGEGPRPAGLVRQEDHISHSRRKNNGSKYLRLYPRLHVGAE